MGLGIQLVLARGEDNVAASLAQLVAICLQGPRVGVKVLVGGKLQPVDKNGGHRDVTQRGGVAHQRQMAGVQVSHGGHHGGVAVGLQRAAQVLNGVDDLHE